MIVYYIETYITSLNIVSNIISLVTTMWRLFNNYVKENSDIKLLFKHLHFEYKNDIIYPSRDLLFEWQRYTRPQDIKVIIFGQDPSYNIIDNNTGIAFNVDNSISKKNIVRELTRMNNDYKEKDLRSWLYQGVLMMNIYSTIRNNIPKSHSHIGWLLYNALLINYIKYHNKDVIIVGFGKEASSKLSNMVCVNSCICVPHPRHHTFYGCNIFNTINILLESNNMTQIYW